MSLALSGTAALAPPNAPMRQRVQGGRQVIRLALVNNMPDGALLDTEHHYRDLIRASLAGTRLQVRLSLHAIGHASRSREAMAAMQGRYHGIGELAESAPDGIIVTGAEPRAADLRHESIWPGLTKVFDLAEKTGVSMMLSCLAAHAACLHFDGIVRRRLASKCSGVFTIEAIGPHKLLAGMPADWRAVHSRLNDLPEQALRDGCHTILGRSELAGAHLFVKQRRGLHVCLQGHPEYAGDTLLKEYRRDVARFLRGDWDCYPSTPSGYFEKDSEQRIEAFGEVARRDRGAATEAGLPDDLILVSPARTWQLAARCVFTNWLQHLADTQACADPQAWSGRAGA